VIKINRKFLGEESLRDRGSGGNFKGFWEEGEKAARKGMNKYHKSRDRILGEGWR